MRQRASAVPSCVESVNHGCFVCYESHARTTGRRSRYDGIDSHHRRPSRRPHRPHGAATPKLPFERWEKCPFHRHCYLVTFHPPPGPLVREVALPHLLELVAVIPLGCLGPDPNGRVGGVVLVVMANAFSLGQQNCGVSVLPNVTGR